MYQQAPELAPGTKQKKLTGGGSRKAPIQKAFDEIQLRRDCFGSTGPGHNNVHVAAVRPIDMRIHPTGRHRLLRALSSDGNSIRAACGTRDMRNPCRLNPGSKVTSQWHSDESG